jgi:SAM-dependent methyltransferase
MALFHPAAIATPQDQINGALYRRADLVSAYVATELYPPEAIALVRYRDDIQDRRVLELGCGAGRLATYLRPLTDHYLGLDCSEHMIAYCRQKLAGLSFVRGDMRELPFAAGSFDAVFAVFNLFDAVDQEDRLKVLAETRRVLRPGGLLVFSSHNRDWKHIGVGPRLRFKLNPLSQARCVVDYLREIANYRRIKSQERWEAEYAVVCDDAHGFAALHYYIRRAVQAQQLTAAGFRLLECLDEMGLTLATDADDRDNSTIHFIARTV